jgi:predicted Zn-dependent protease
VTSAYSRDAERAADSFAADIMRGLGRSPRPLGVFLNRLMRRQSGNGKALAFLQSHPPSEERLAALSKAEPASPGAPLLSEDEWRALRAICGRQRPPAPAARPERAEGESSGSSQ